MSGSKGGAYGYMHVCKGAEICTGAHEWVGP